MSGNCGNCKECLLFKKKRFACPDCFIDFSNKEEYNKKFKEVHNKNSQANVIVRKHKNHTELLYFKKEFSISGNHKTGERKRHFTIDDGVIKKVDPNDPNVTWWKFFRTKRKTSARSIDNFYNYGFNNDWQYFLTITFNPNKILSTDEQTVKYCWKCFRQRLQYYYRDIEILCVIEYHKDNKKMHFHSLIGNCDLTNILTLAVDNQPYKKDKDGNFVLDSNLHKILNQHYLKPIIGDFGEFAYNLKPQIYDLGFTTVYDLWDKNSDATVNERITHYLSKYMTKDTATPFNGKMYFHTYNLEKGQKFYCMRGDEMLERLIAQAEDIYLKKSTSKFDSIILKGE